MQSAVAPSCNRQGTGHGRARRANSARFPVQLPEFFIKFLTEEGDLVLDPFAGSCTAGEAAGRHRRRWIGFDPVPDYLDAARFRFDRGDVEPASSSSVADANGQVEKITIQDLVQIAGDWSSRPFAPKQAQVAWIGADPSADSFQRCVRLFKYTWPNPHPDWEISHVDLVSTKSNASYELVAMTLE